MLSKGAARLFEGMALSVIFILCIPFSFAHLDGGFDQEVNGYLIDVGYDPNPIFADYPLMLSIGVLNATTQAPIEVSKVWVRLSTEEGVVYAATHLPEHGVAPLSMILPKAGEYTLSVRFYQGDGPKSIASADFPLTVNGGAGSSGAFGNSWAVLFLFSGMVVAGIVGFIFGKAVKTVSKSKRLK